MHTNNKSRSLHRTVKGKYALNEQPISDLELLIKRKSQRSYSIEENKLEAKTIVGLSKDNSRKTNKFDLLEYKKMLKDLKDISLKDGVKNIYKEKIKNNFSKERDYKYSLFRDELIPLDESTTRRYYFLYLSGKSSETTKGRFSLERGRILIIGNDIYLKLRFPSDKKIAKVVFKICKNEDYFLKNKSLDLSTVVKYINIGFQTHKIKPQLGYDSFGKMSEFVSKILNYVSMSGSIIENVHEVSEGALSLIKKSKNAFSKSFILDLSLLFLELLDPSVVFSCNKMLRILIGIYKLVNNLENNFIEKQVGLEPLLLAASTNFLPASLLSLLKKASLFTNTKLCDDFNLFGSFVKEILNFLSSFLSNSKIGLIIIDFFNKIKEYFNLDIHYVLILKANKLLEAYKLDKKIVLNDDFCEEITIIMSKLQSSGVFNDLKSKNSTLKKLEMDISRVYKIVIASQSIGRVEPNCFVFEGPPGCCKSLLMKSLIEGIGEPVYMHSVKPSSDGKDFYDTYNQENIFCMDDVGQMGISQWRTVINMVAPVKYPLDCAAQELKDTKFFNSETLLLSTNNLRNLGQPLRSDGISDINALYRRCYVFAFEDVKRDDLSISVKINFMSFDLEKNKFVNDFPISFKNFLKSYNLTVATSVDMNNTTASMFSVIKWMKLIIDGFKKYKDMLSTRFQLTKDQKDELNKNVFKEINFNSLYVSVKDYLNIVLDALQDDWMTLIYRALSLYSAAGVAISLIIMPLIRWFSRDKDENEIFKVPLLPKGVDSGNSINTLRKNLFVAEFINYEGVNTGNCVVLLSGHHLITVNHSYTASDTCRVNVYKDISKCFRLLDNIIVKKIYIDIPSDLAIYSFDKNLITPFKNMSKFFSRVQTTDQMFMVTAEGVVDLANKFTSTQGTITYELSEDFDSLLSFELIQSDNIRNISDKTKAIGYNFGKPGLCGSLIAAKDGSIRGIHVAGYSNTTGFSTIWSEKVRRNIASILKEDNNFILDVNIKDKEFEQYSGIPIDVDFKIFTPKKTNLKKTELYGLFPVSRVPSDLTIFGNHTIKDIEKKSLQPVVSIPEREINFSGEIIDSLLPEKIEQLNEQEIVQGNEYLARLNKKSSNGYGTNKSKSYYIDYDKGCFTPEFRLELKRLESDIETGRIKCDEIVWQACLKDELRNLEKGRIPRSFQICRIHIQVLTKKYFGKLVEYLIRTRNQNQVMVGVNPYKEWNNIYNDLVTCQKIWAGDIGSYDGAMLPQLQFELNKRVLSKIVGDKKVPSFLLNSMPISLVGVNDDAFITTHSMPSGCFLTAIFNSLINRMYTSIWFFRYYKGVPSVVSFKKNVVDYVYGDDKVNAIRTLDFDTGDLNALTMKETFESLGMKFTKSDKSEVLEPNENINEISFLKRKFVFHREIGSIVCPLDLRSLYSTISFYDSTKDKAIVLRDKINAFQRELYLHEDLYQNDITKLFNFCKEHRVSLNPVDEVYLRNLYVTAPDLYFSHIDHLNI